jgi:hypothetical protein
MAAFDQSARRPVRVLRFVEYGGLLVSVRTPPSFRALELLQHATSVLGETLDGNRAPVGERIPALGSLYRAFADSLVRWDLRDDGGVVPPTEDGVLAQDHEFLFAVARAWYRRVVLAPPEQLAKEQEAAPAPDPVSEAEDLLASVPTVALPEPASVGSDTE